MTSPSRVLVVEDDERFAQAAALLLRRAHREVVVASDARSAREAASSGRFDAFVVDLGLPDEDGVELVRWLAGRAPHAPILVSTVARARATILDAVRAGASGYLFKEDMARRLARPSRSCCSAARRCRRAPRRSSWTGCDRCARTRSAPRPRP
ncbi:MAG: response regulator [Sandaracinaceae bacterium]|nr:response regulator [Sandaracinaceae bacterium]